MFYIPPLPWEVNFIPILMDEPVDVGRSHSSIPVDIGTSSFGIRGGHPAPIIDVQPWGELKCVHLGLNIFRERRGKQHGMVRHLGTGVRIARVSGAPQVSPKGGKNLIRVEAKCSSPRKSTWMDPSIL